jgi:type I restriction enzyme S subunit
MKGWEVKELGAVSTIKYGYTESASNEPIGPRFLRITDIQDEHVDWENVPYCKIESSEFPKYRLTSGDIVFARTGATTGKSFLVDNPPDAVFASYLIRLRLLEKKLMPEFVALFFQTAGYWKSIKDGSSGSAQGGFNASKLGALSIPIPPIPEQQRIVGILDEAFDGIATAKANAEKNLQNARAIFESHLQSVFTQRGEGRIEKKMGDVCEVKDGTHYSPQYVVDGIPFITQKNIRENGLSFTNTKFISQEDHENFYRRSNVACGDILISMIGANRGMACIVDDKRIFSIKNVGLVKQNSNVNQKFLLYFLKAPQAANYVRSGSKGGAQEFIGLTELRSFPVHLPSLTLQNTIATMLETLSIETQRLESIYQQKLIGLEALKKSLLHQAFNGQL